MPYILNNYLKLDSSFYGFINAFFPVGLILGAIMVGIITAKYSENGLLLALSYIASLLILLVGIPIFASIFIVNKWTSLVYFSLIMIAFGFIISLIDIPIMTRLQKSIDEAYRGRALGIFFTMIKVINPIAYFIGGFCVNRINPFYIPLVVGFLLFIFIVVKRKLIIE